MANRVDTYGNTIEEVAAATVQVGTFAFTASGVAKFYNGKGADSQPVEAGATTNPLVGNVNILIDKANATDVFALGADVFGDATAQTALTIGGDGTLGYAAAASANGDLQVLVRLNKN